MRRVRPQLQGRTGLGSLVGKVVLVTGASKGVGKAIAMLLASEGAAVVMVARSEGELRAAAEEVTQAGGKVVAHAADVADPGRWQMWYAPRGKSSVASMRL